MTKMNEFFKNLLHFSLIVFPGFIKGLLEILQKKERGYSLDRFGVWLNFHFDISSLTQISKKKKKEEASSLRTSRFSVSIMSGPHCRCNAFFFFLNIMIQHCHTIQSWLIGCVPNALKNINNISRVFRFYVSASQLDWSFFCTKMAKFEA